MYGIDQEITRDYGTRCLIARRLVERGVRFVQILCQGHVWDHHGSILTALPQRCREIDNKRLKFRVGPRHLMLVEQVDARVVTELLA